MRRAFLLYMLAATAPHVSFAQAARGPKLSGKLLITGSSTMAPMVGELASRFRALHPEVVITVETGGSGRGVADALQGKADIGMASRELTTKEQALFAIPIARDGVTFIVHRDNPVNELSRAQVRAVLTGSITGWESLGGWRAPIEVVARTPERGVMEIVSPYLGIGPAAIKAAHLIGENADVTRFIAANRNAIAIFSVGAADHGVQHGLPLKPLRLDGTPAGIDSVRDGRWPLSRPLNLLTGRVPTGAAKAFIEFALSPEARTVILQYDFVPYVN